MVEQGDQLGRDAAEMGEAFALDRREYRPNVERIVDQRRAEVGDLHRDARHRADVREREAGSQVLLEARQPVGVAARLDVGDREEARMRVARTLRRPGRAAGEHDRSRVVGVDGRRRGRRRPERSHHARRAALEIGGVEPEHLA